ncbi:Imm45 family immunity protein [Agrobacterium sp. NPDC089420]|uniref:Imm45 family immunity protein n=1 Tax=Agrobacterium sp. NPDC089420 TaxID=3363918 RepID=UPI00384ABA3D
MADLNEKEIGRGAVFRVKAEYPYEAVVDFMLVETTDAERPLGIMVATGYSAGHIFVHLPYEALMKGTRMLSTVWLKQNWEKWVYRKRWSPDTHCHARSQVALYGYQMAI